MYVGQVHTGFWWGSLREENYLENSGVGWRIILKLIFEECEGWREGMDLIDLAQDRERWRSLVNAVMNLRVPEMQGISLLVEYLLVSQEGSAPWSQ